MKKKVFIVVAIAAILAAGVTVFAACDSPKTQFRAGYASVQNGDGLFGYVDASGNQVLPFAYTDAYPFVDGVGMVNYTNEGDYYIIDGDGKHLAGPYSSVDPYTLAYGNIIVEDAATGLFGIYDASERALSYGCVYGSIIGIYGENSDIVALSYASAPIGGGQNSKEYIKAVELSTGKETFPATITDEVEMLAGKWVIGRENGKFAVYDITTGERYSDGLWDRCEEFYATGSSECNACLLYRTEEDGSESEWIVQAYEIVRVPDGAELVRTWNMSVSTLPLVYNQADGQYTLYSHSGEVLYTGSEQPQYVPAREGGSDFYCLSTFENGILSARIFSYDREYNVTRALPAGTTGAQIYNIKIGDIVTVEISFTLNAVRNFCSCYMAADGQMKELPFNLTITDAGNNLLEVRNNVSGRTGVYDLDAKEVIPCIYADLWIYSDGNIRCKLGDSYGVLTSDGTQVLPFIYKDIYLQ